MYKPIQVTSPSMPPFEEYCDEIREIWNNRWLTNSGVKHQQFERELKQFLDSPCVQLFCNGHLALELAIKAMELSGEVITTPFTFGSTTQAILRNGLKPIFCDIEPTHYTIDADKIEELITEHTCAIIPVHVYGNICDHEKIKRIAKKYDLKVIYDAAHAFGETVNGVNVSNLGDCSMFSFHATKVFNTIEGGALTFADKTLEKKFMAIRQFGMYGKEDAEMIGTNAKMTEFQAAMGICNLRHIDEYISARKQCAEKYRQRLSGIPGIRLSPIQENVRSNYSYFPVVFEKEIFGFSRDEVADRLASENIYARKYFYPLTSEFSVCKEMYGKSSTPVASEIASGILALPLSSELDIATADRICDIILSQ